MRLTAADAARIEAFLAARPETSMFLRSNLRRAGVDDHGQRYGGTWVGAGDPLAAVAVHVSNGNLLLQAPVDAGPVAVEAVARSGRPVDGLIGPWAQVEAARAALGLAERPARLAEREDLFSLRLDDLVVPASLTEGRCTGRRAGSADLERLAAWRYDYELEANQGVPRPALVEQAAATVRAMIGDGVVFVAEVDGAPVASSTFNATLPDRVQIGGVWTPVALRGRGYARCCVAASLRIARAEGVSASILFTPETNAPARRAYLALGYRIVGDYAVVLFA